MISESIIKEVVLVDSTKIGGKGDDSFVFVRSE